MKRCDIKSTSLLLMVLLALIVTACGKNTDITTTTVKEEPKTESGDEMKGYDLIYTHMSGMQQTREEFFSDISDGSLRYYTIGIADPIIEVDQAKARITYTSVLNANAYGSRGTGRINTNVYASFFILKTY